MNEPARDAIALGVDGGAGALRVAVRPPDGAVVHHEARGANPALIGLEPFLDRLAEAIEQALARCGLETHAVASAGLGLSGVDRPAEIERLTRLIRARILPGARRLWVGNDALPALRWGAGRLEGLVLIAGTGSICLAVASPARMTRVGGWGGELGDEGSGFWIGQRALQAACRMADGRLERSLLLDEILHHLGLTTPEALIPWCSGLSREAFKTATASLYPVVARRAVLRDKVARNAISMGIAHLVQLTLTAERHWRRMGGVDSAPAGQAPESGDAAAPESGDEQPALAGVPDAKETVRSGSAVKLVCAGGLFAGDEAFYRAFLAQLRRREAFDPVRLTDPPALGALALGEEAPPL